jgi:hypothetical protein
MYILYIDGHVGAAGLQMAQYPQGGLRLKPAAVEFQYG